MPHGPQAVGHHQQGRAHVGKDGHPHGGVTGEGQGEEQRLDAQRQRDVLHQDGEGGPGQADEAGDLAQVVVHERHVGGLDGGVRAVAGHGETDVGLHPRG